MLLEAVGDELALTFAAATHVENADAVVFGQSLGNVESLQATAAQSMQIDQTLDIHLILLLPDPVQIPVPDEGALQFLLPMVV